MPQKEKGIVSATIPFIIVKKGDYIEKAMSFLTDYPYVGAHFCR